MTPCYRFSLLFFLCFYSLFASAATTLTRGPVWEVSKHGQSLYIGGTIHLLSASDFPLPLAFDQAYKQSDTVIFEVDPDDLLSPELQAYSAQYLFYRDGRNLSSVLSEESLSRLSDYFSSHHVPIQTVLSMKPGMILIMATQLELQRLNAAKEGVDQYYSRKASADNKPKGQLESAKDQIVMLSRLSEGIEDEFIRYVLDDMQKLPHFLQRFKSAWRAGDRQSMLKVTELEVWRHHFPQVYNEIMRKRNNAWMPQIEHMLTSPEVELILVGALHLLGEDGLLHQLVEKGYRIRQL